MADHAGPARTPDRGRPKPPVPCPMCGEGFSVKRDLQVHLVTAHEYRPKARRRKGKPKRYMPVEKQKLFGGAFWAMAGATVGIILLIGLFAPEYLRAVIPVGMLLLGASRAGMFRS
jgi:uncharacterized C2H2 Zn-finger protein